MAEAIGFISFYGLTPSIDFFKGTGISLEEDDRELNVLMSDCADIRHVMKSLCD